MSSPISHPTDFPDRFSPMLVKELRQGMRAKTFIAVFLSLQIFLAVMLFSAGAASTSEHVGSVVSSIIFTLFSIAVLVVQPLRGTGALSSEVKGNTIDMMVLTRLSAWRIVMGKWVALVSQSALLFSTIIPYLILRYFFGGMNLVAEMVFLVVVFLTSMALTAVTVGLSGCHSVIIRSLIPIFGLPIGMWMLLMVSLSSRLMGSSDFMEAFNLDSTESRVGVSVYLASIIYVGGNFLSLGASLIAPAAENHSWLRRLIAMVLLALVFLVGFHPDVEDEVVVLIVAVVSLPAVIIAFTDSSLLVSTVCAPFTRRGLLGRGLGWLMYPSWASGILAGLAISLLALVSMVVHMQFRGNNFDEEELVALFAIFGGFLFPAVWQVFLFKGEGQRIAHYLMLLVGSFILAAVLTGLSDSMDSGAFLWVFAWHPLAFLAMLEEKSMPDSFMLAAVFVLDLVLILILLIKVFKEMAAAKPVIEESLSNPPEGA